MSPSAAAKAVFRRALRARRRRAQQLFGRHAAEGAARHLFAGVPVMPGRIVALYWPFGSELDPRPLIRPLVRKRRAVIVLPVVIGEGKPLIFRRFRPGTRLFPSLRGMRAPGRLARALKPDLVLVPLLAYDPSGNRLGLGAGFYDRTLAELRRQGRVRAIGFAFAAQAVPALPRDSFDQRLDWIVTETSVRKIR